VAERLTGWQHVSISIPNVIRTAHAVPEYCRSGSEGSFSEGRFGGAAKAISQSIMTGDVAIGF